MFSLRVCVSNRKVLLSRAVGGERGKKILMDFSERDAKQPYTSGSCYKPSAVVACSTTEGSGCTTVVEHTPCNREVMDSNHARCLAFFSSLCTQ